LGWVSDTTLRWQFFLSSQVYTQFWGTPLNLTSCSKLFFK
jgi:hypothetical protein